MITSYTDTVVEIKWEAPYDWGIPIRGYEVEHRSCDIFYATQEASECDGYRSGYSHAYPTHYGTHMTHKIMNLDPGKMYFFHVRAFNIFDQYMSPNNYGIWSYDSLAVTTWRVPDKMPAPVPHEVECHMPHSAVYGEEELPYNLKLYDITTTVEGTVPGAATATDADPTTARPECSIHLSWITPFSGAVQNPLIDHSIERDSVGGLRNCDSTANAGRAFQGKRWGTESCKDGVAPGPEHSYDRRVDIHNNDIINYRIYYHATQVRDLCQHAAFSHAPTCPRSLSDSFVSSSRPRDRCIPSLTSTTISTVLSGVRFLTRRTSDCVSPITHSPVRKAGHLALTRLIHRYDFRHF